MSSESQLKYVCLIIHKYKFSLYNLLVWSNLLQKKPVKSYQNLLGSSKTQGKVL